MKRVNKLLEEMNQVFNNPEALKDFKEFFSDKMQKQFWFAIDKTLHQYMDEDKSKGNENSVKIGVGLGQISEYAICKIFNEFKSSDFHPLEHINTPSGDYVWDGISIELKTSRVKRNKNGIDVSHQFQGATHSSRKSEYYLLVKLDIDHDIPLSSDESFLKGLFISFVKIDNGWWKGTASNNNSRTTLRIPNEFENEFENGIVIGSIRELSRKYIKFGTKEI